MSCGELPQPVVAGGTRYSLEIGAEVFVEDVPDIVHQKRRVVNILRIILLHVGLRNLGVVITVTA